LADYEECTNYDSQPLCAVETEGNNSFLGQDNLTFYTPARTSEGTTMFRPPNKEVSKDNITRKFTFDCDVPSSQAMGSFELANETAKPQNHTEIPRTTAHSYAVGSFAHFFKPDIDAYTHDIILYLIVFYSVSEREILLRCESRDFDTS